MHVGWVMSSSLVCRYYNPPLQPAHPIAQCMLDIEASAVAALLVPQFLGAFMKAALLCTTSSVELSIGGVPTGLACLIMSHALSENNFTAPERTDRIVTHGKLMQARQRAKT